MVSWLRAEKNVKLDNAIATSKILVHQDPRVRLVCQAMMDHQVAMASKEVLDPVA